MIEKHKIHWGLSKFFEIYKNSDKTLICSETYSYNQESYPIVLTIIPLENSIKIDVKIKVKGIEYNIELLNYFSIKNIGRDFIDDFPSLDPFFRMIFSYFNSKMENNSFEWKELDEL